MERHLLGSILYLALTSKINIKEVLSYPLTPIPLRLCHTDGKMSKTTKCTLMEELEKLSILNNPAIVDLVIVEEMFFLQLLSDSSETFECSRSILRKLCCSFSAKRIDIVFDKIVAPSIRDNERDIRV